MSERKIPSYRLHKSSGQAVVTLTDPSTRRRRDVLLGKHGTATSRAEYLRVLAEREAAGRRLPDGKAGSPDLTVHELVQAFWKHVEAHYRDQGGEPTSEVQGYHMSLRPLRFLYGPTLAREFGPLGLKAVRQLMIDGYEHPRYGRQEPLCRGVINQRIGRIRRAFKWASENELIPAVVHHALRDVRGLARGRSPAAETKPVAPVADAVVDATLPFLNRHLRALVELQRLTGARPGEVCILRACDLDMSGPVWLYRPARHKTAHHGKTRILAIGPKAQAILREFLTLDTQAYLFSPRLALEEVRAARHLLRKTRVQPSQQNRRKRRPSKGPGECWTVTAYAHAIKDACARAFPAPDPLEQQAGETAKKKQPVRKRFAAHPHLQQRWATGVEPQGATGLAAGLAAGLGGWVAVIMAGSPVWGCRSLHRPKLHQSLQYVNRCIKIFQDNLVRSEQATVDVLPQVVYTLASTPEGPRHDLCRAIAGLEATSRAHPGAARRQ